MITTPHLYSAVTSFLASLPPHLPHSFLPTPSLSCQNDPFKTELNHVTPVFNLPAASRFIQVTPPKALQGPHNLYNPFPSLKFCFLLGYSLAQDCCVAWLSKAPPHLICRGCLSYLTLASGRPTLTSLFNMKPASPTALSDLLSLLYLFSIALPE